MNSPYVWDSSLNLFRREQLEAFAYSDGEEVEARLFDLVRGARDRSTFSNELNALITDWASEYHLSRSRHLIVRPLGIKPGDSVLELGCGCGAITRYLGEIGAQVTSVEGSLSRARIAAERCRDLPNVRVVVDDLQRYASNETFDWVLLIGVLEYAPSFSKSTTPALAYLKSVAPRVSSAGKLVIAIENQLGLKYFNGCAEDHLGRPYAGLQDLYEPHTVRTFGRAALHGLISTAGFSQVEFLYPFPDYKLPQAIITERGMDCPAFSPGDILSRCVARDYTGNQYRNFDDGLAALVLSKNGLLGELSNSFLVVASNTGSHITSDILTTLYAPSRQPSFITETTFRFLDDQVRIERCRVFDRPIDVSVSGNVLVHSIETGPYVNGTNYIFGYLKGLISANTPNDLAALLQRWFDELLRHSVDGADPSGLRPSSNDLGSLHIPGVLFDLTPFNLMEHQGHLVIIDQEWRFSANVSLGWVAIRGIAYTLSVGLRNQSALVAITDVLRLVCTPHGLTFTDSEFSHWCALEFEFLSSVTSIPAASHWCAPEVDVLSSAPPIPVALSHSQSLGTFESEKLRIERAENAARSLNSELQKAHAELANAHAKLAEFDRLVSQIEVERGRIKSLHDELNRVLQSRSWRITRPLRFAGHIARGERALVMAGLRRLLSTAPVLIPVHRIASAESIPESTEIRYALDTDQQFEIGQIDRFSGNWTRLSIDIVTDRDWIPRPILFLDCGGGYIDENSIVLPQPEPGQHRITYILWLPNGLRRAKLGSLAQEGNFRVDAVFIQVLARSHALVAMARAIKHRHGLRRLVGIARRALLPVPTPSRVRNYAVRIADQYRALVSESATKTYNHWIAAFEPTPDIYPMLVAQHLKWVYRPLISIIVPVYNAPETVLRAAIESVRNQIYSQWELCIADDASTEPHVRNVLQEFSARDSRVKVAYRQQNGHIGAASNSALELATGEFVALLDHDDLLHPLALHFIVEAINRHPDVELIYTDEDKVDEQGQRFDPYFKCDFNYELLLGQNMICHLGTYRRSLLQEIGGFRTGYEGAQDYDLALRAIEQLASRQIVHVPRVLYHWRAMAGSTALAADEKPYAAVAARKAIAEHLARQGVNAEVMPAPEAPAMNRVRYALPQPVPMVSIVIPTRDRPDLLAQCLDSLLEKTCYPNYEVIIVDNGSVDLATFTLFARMPADRVRVLRDDSPFNYSALNNRAVAQARGDVVCLRNNDIEIIHGDWLDEMVSFAMRPDIGAVGARLWYPDGRLQHGGVILGIGGVAGHAHKYLDRGRPGYFGRAVLHQSLSAVTAACLVIRKDIYTKVGKLDEQLTVAFNDVDFCLRVREAGYRNLWTPFAELIHHESATRGYETTPEKQQRFLREITIMKTRWRKALLQDPAYSPNLSLDSENFSVAWPPRIQEQEMTNDSATP